MRLQKILDDMYRLKMTRQSTSHGKAIEELEANIKQELSKIKELLV